jgi:hypothetical protein
MIAWFAPSGVGRTFVEGGRGSAGSAPNVTVWFIEGSRFLHSTVSPTRTTIVSRKNRISDAVCEPAPVIVTISPKPTATSLFCPRSFGTQALVFLNSIARMFALQ